MPQTYLTIEQLAARMGIEVETIYRRRSDRLPMPPAIKFGRKLMFREEAVDAFMLAHEEKAAA